MDIGLRWVSPKDVARAVCVLDRAGVRALTLKGPIFSIQVYGADSARHSRDIDLLIDPSERSTAIASLESIGYQALPRSNGLIREIHLVHDYRPCIDLHWHPAGAEFSFAYTFDELWRESSQIEVGESVINTLSLPWLVVFTAFLVMRDMPLLEKRHLDDLAALVAKFPDLDWTRAEAISRSTRTKLLTTIALHLIERLQCISALPVSCRVHFPATHRASRQVQAIASRFENRGFADKAKFFSKLASVCGHYQLREDWRDGLRPIVFLLFFLILPEGEDIDRSFQTGRSSWFERALRTRDFVLALTKRCADAGRRRLFRYSLHRTGTNVRPAEKTSLHIVGDDAVLFDGVTESLFGLTQPAAWLWCQLEDGKTIGKIEKDCIQRFGDADDRTEDAIRAQLTRWWDLGLIDCGLARDPPQELEAFLPNWQDDIAPARHIRRYRILDTVIEIGLPSLDVAARADSLLGHLTISSDAKIRLDVIKSEDAYLIIRDGKIVEQSPTLLGAGPQIKSAALVAAINSQDYALYLHAAMVRRGQQTILLPAAPGSGKTCLSAALAYAGYRYHTDEITLLVGDRLKARGVPLALTIKQQAVAVLAPLFMEIVGLSVHERVDGKLCRYMPPPSAPKDDLVERSWPVTHLIFPRFDPKAATHLSPISPFQALEKLLGHCLAVPSGLDHQLIECLVSWTEGLSAFELIFSDLSEAIEAIGDVLPSCGDEASRDASIVGERDTELQE